MQYQKGLLLKHLKSLQKTAWYHQRFDGCPQFLGLAIFPHFSKDQRKPRGTHFTEGFAIYTKGTADWHINIKDIERVTKIFIQKSQKETNISKRLINKWKNDKKIFYQECKKIDKLDLPSLSFKEFLKIYKRFVYLYQKWFSMTSLIDGFALGSDEFINDEINKLLEARGIKKGKGKIFAALTAPTDISFINDVEISLLRIALKIRTKPALVKFFVQNSPSKIVAKLKAYPKILKLLTEHQQKYVWSNNNYISNYLLTVEDFILELKKIFGGKIEIKKHLLDLEKQPKFNRRKKTELLKKLRASKFLKNLIEISEDFTTWQDQRKKSTFFATHYIPLILDEVAKRTDYTLHELKFFMYDEIVNLLSQKGRYPSLKEVRERIKYSFFYHRGLRYDFATGEKAKQTLKEILKKGEKQKVDDFRGMTACPGKVTGRVRIIKSVQDAHKIRKGEILVAVMTRPDYIAGIKKAAALVTNEG